MRPKLRRSSPIELRPTMAWVAALASLAGCFGATDAIPLRIDGGTGADAGVGERTDAGSGPWTGSTNDLACYPVNVFQVTGGFGFSWTQGTAIDAGDFLGVLVEPSERASAESFLGHGCSGELVVAGKVLCEVFDSFEGPPTHAAYETICAFESALGPHGWIARSRQ